MKLKYSLVLVSLLVASSSASTLKDVVSYTLKNNSDVLSKSYNNQSFNAYIDEQEGGYYPTIDLNASYETRKTNQSPGNDYKQNGYDASLTLEQILFDGGLTSNLVAEAQSNYEANKFKNSNDVESIVLEAVNSYLNILKAEEKISLSEENIENHKKYLEIAVQTEIINGAVLDKVQTKAKINQAKSNLYNEMNNKVAAQSSFKRNVGMRLDNTCKPTIDEKAIPSDFNELLKSTLKSNYSILEQSKNIETQRAVVEQSDAAFKPTVSARLQANADDDLTNENIETNSYLAAIEMRYNLYRGKSDVSANEKERLVLKEEQQKFDVITKAVEDELRVAYETYQTSKKQIKELKELIVNNKQIISIYKDQFDAGTRSFIDVLNVEADLFNSKLNLVDTEFNLYQSYYNILRLNSSLGNTVLKSAQNKCADPRLQKTTEIDENENLLKEATK